MVLLDTDILVLAFAFHGDDRQPINTRFLRLIQDQQPGVTIYSVMEFLGQLSFNLSAERLGQWPSWLRDHYNLTVIYPETAGLDATSFFQTEIIDRPFALMQAQRMPFLDALILGLAEKTEGVRTFVTWNVRHFRDKTALTVLTPTEYLDSLI